MPTNIKDFNDAIQAWMISAATLAEYEGQYTRAYGAALATADGKTESIRSGQADIAVQQERKSRDTARINEQAARWVVQYLMAEAGRGNGGVA